MRGQAMLEFALVLPFFFVLVFGIMDGCLLVFSVSSAQYAATEGDKTAAQSGNATSPRDADQLAIDAVRSVLGPTGIIQVSSIEIYRLSPDLSGNLVQDASRTNVYRLNGSRVGSYKWPPDARDVSNSSSDYIGVRIHYSYVLHASFLPNTLPSDFTAASASRVEPQTF